MKSAKIINFPPLQPAPKAALLNASWVSFFLRYGHASACESLTDHLTEQAVGFSATSQQFAAEVVKIDQADLATAEQVHKIRCWGAMLTASVSAIVAAVESRCPGAAAVCTDAANAVMMGV